MSKEKQVKNSFDKKTLSKIAKGAGITAFYSITVFILTYVQSHEMGNALFYGFATQLIPTALNALKEWFNGEMKEYK